MEPLTGLPLLLSNAGSVVTAAVGWMGSYLHTITATGNEVLLLFAVIPLVGIGVGLVRRMLHV